jgi:hypothetical protein
MIKGGYTSDNEATGSLGSFMIIVLILVVGWVLVMQAGSKAAA